MVFATPHTCVPKALLPELGEFVSQVLASLLDLLGTAFLELLG